MLTVYQPPPAWGLPNVSPFCVKLETYLRMAEIPYRVKRPRPGLGPKGKIPYVRDGELVLGDSGLIIDHLRATRGDVLDAHLDARQRAIGLLVRRTLEESTYFAVGYLRWTSPDAWPHIVEAFAPLMPPMLGGVIMRRLRTRLVARAWAQGAARHTAAELYAMIEADLRALDELVGDGPFLFGERPSSYDATLYGFFAQVAYVPWASEEQRRFRGFPRLVAYTDRMRARYWSA